MEALVELGSPSPGNLPATLDRIDTIGPSSGWDSLTGAVAVCVALCRR